MMINIRDNPRIRDNRLHTQEMSKVSLMRLTENIRKSLHLASELPLGPNLGACRWNVK